MIVAGIDPSLTGTAVCVSGPDGSDCVRLSSKSGGVGVEGRILRYETLAEDVREIILRASESYSMIFIEGYAFAARGSASIALAEFGGILRLKLLSVSNLVEVNTSSLKKFATGTGNAKKLAVALACQKRWGVTYETDDEFDAYVLARIGRCYVGLEEPETAFQREVVEELKHGKAKRKKGVG